MANGRIETFEEFRDVLEKCSFRAIKSRVAAGLLYGTIARLKAEGVTSSAIDEALVRAGIKGRGNLTRFLRVGKEQNKDPYALERYLGLDPDAWKPSAVQGLKAAMEVECAGERASVADLVDRNVDKNSDRRMDRRPNPMPVAEDTEQIPAQPVIPEEEPPLGDLPGDPFGEPDIPAPVPGSTPEAPRETPRPVPTFSYGDGKTGVLRPAKKASQIAKPYEGGKDGLPGTAEDRQDKGKAWPSDPYEAGRRGGIPAGARPGRGSEGGNHA